MAKPVVRKGSFAVPSRGVGREFEVFMFNPNDVSDDHVPNWGSITVPGASHPIYAFGSGGERLISFDLYLDGDRGRASTSLRDSRESTAPQFRGDSLSVQTELKWYRSLVLPKKYGAGHFDVYPYTVLFTMGPLYKGLPCIVKRANWKINYWTPQMQPVRATVSIQLAEITEKSITADEFFQGVSR